MLAKQVSFWYGKNGNALLVPQYSRDEHVFELEFFVFEAFFDQFIVCLSRDEVARTIARRWIVGRQKLFLCHRIFACSPYLNGSIVRESNEPYPLGEKIGQTVTSCRR